MDISELSRTSTLNISDYILISNDSGTKSYRIWDETLYEIADMKSSVNPRRNIYRGKNLGTAVTDTQWEEIRSGRFRDMFIGDYWVIGGVKWVICDFNYFDSPSNHAVIMPKTSLGSSKFMENEERATQGYYGSYVRKTGLNDAKSIIYSAFGSNHITTYRTGLINSASDSEVLGHINEDVTIELGDARMFCLSPMESYLGDSKDYLPLAITLLNGKGNKYYFGTESQPEAMMTRSIYTNNALIVQWENGATSSSPVSKVLALRPVFGIKG